MMGAVETDSDIRPWRHLELAAWVACALHLLAGLALLVLLRDGLDTNPDLMERFGYVQEHMAAWTIGWCSWHAASLSIVVFFLMLFRAAAAFRESVIGLCAVVLVIIAAAMDLAGQSLLIGFAPSIPGVATVEAWMTVQRIAVILSGYAANGLYSIATLLAVLVLRRQAARLVSALGVLVFVSGIALSIAAILNSALGMYATNAILLPVLLAWLIGVALTARREAARASS